MAISRPFLLALIGVALLGATVFAVQNARNTGSDAPAPVAQKPAEQAAPAQAPAPEPAKAEPLTAEEALAAILEPGTPVDSARFSFAFETQEVAGGREHDTARITGAFDDADKGSGISNFDIRVRERDEVSAGKLDSAYNVHLTAVDEKGYVGEGNKMYAIPQSAMTNIAALRTAFSEGGVAKLPEFQLTRWVTDPKVVGTEEMDGVEATHVRGDVAAGSVASDIVRLMTVEASGAGAEPAVPANTQGIAKRSVKDARLDAWVGPDRIVRRARLAVSFDAPKQLREPGDSVRWTADLDLRLSEVNKPQSIEAPEVQSGSRAKGLGRQDADSAENTFAVFAMGLDAPGGVSGTTFSFLALNRLSDDNKVARKVLGSVRDRKETVVFFRNPKALDDRMTARSVQYLDKHTKKLAVFTDDVANTEHYGRLVENLGVTQAPAIVFIDRRGTASLVEGYVDGPSLAQVVADRR
jgi:hypothetical protein